MQLKISVCDNDSIMSDFHGINPMLSFPLNSPFPPEDSGHDIQDEDIIQTLKILLCEYRSVYMYMYMCFTATPVPEDER